MGDVIKIPSTSIHPLDNGSVDNLSKIIVGTDTFNDDIEFTLNVKSAEAKQIAPTGGTVHSHVKTIIDDKAKAVRRSQGWQEGDQFYILPHDLEKVYDNPEERIFLAKSLKASGSKKFAVGRVDKVDTQLGILDGTLAADGSLATGTGIYWHDDPLHSNGAVIAWTLIDSGYANYASGGEQKKKGYTIIAGANEWDTDNYLSIADKESLDEEHIKKLWENQPGCACVYKDSILKSDFKGVSTYIVDDTIVDGDVGYAKWKVNNTADATNPAIRGYSGLEPLNITERRANLRVMINEVEHYTLKSHTGGFVNDRPFFTDAKMCSVPWGKTLNVKIVDMSHGERSASDPAVTHYHTLKECNDENDSQVITSVTKPITVELKVLLIDPEDQNSNY